MSEDSDSGMSFDSDAELTVEIPKAFDSKTGANRFLDTLFANEGRQLHRTRSDAKYLRVKCTTSPGCTWRLNVTCNDAGVWRVSSEAGMACLTHKRCPCTGHEKERDPHVQN